MKIMLFFVAFASLTVAQTPMPQKNRQVFLDFRVDRKIAELKIPPATERRVLSKLFRKYLKDSSNCNSNFDAADGPDPLAAARKAGEIVPSIIDMAAGSFTAAGQMQTLYVISVSECNASHADNFGTKRVAIFSGEKLLADVDADFAANIVRKTDLDRDGIDELLMTTGDMAQGTVTEMATLVSFQNGRRRVIQDFGAVVEDSCASEAPGATSEASVIYMTETLVGMPKLTQENFSASCKGKTRRWKLVSRGKRG